MKNKSHKWGTKLFMMCYSTKAYCSRTTNMYGRFKVYLGANEALTDYKSGPAAVIRNFGEVFVSMAQDLEL
ncbi:hypothetical protein PPTG_23122 [Phytophthora nicotianae INRA-310]|uniref:PiggyBac transposable element-derived protein domain-containing protein n=1 Tax=Phytophthora nicotianae (strain INRA-310) TaxID=761204 RepID=W2Q560_PHYN3|nr:hypothetical protein PPTG_23122 [Phytophthora nicotianae INRA-310]ETN08011.1 hypothetical protein PPTG_23122 [Phytophthora nicotianae INRA-310]